MVKDTDEQPYEGCLGRGLGGPECQGFCPCGGGVCHLPGVDVFAHLAALRTLCLGCQASNHGLVFPVTPQEPTQSHIVRTKDAPSALTTLEGF